MKITSLREIERNCNENIKFKYLLNGASSPDYTTISKFMKKCESVLDDIFNQFNRKILEKQGINTDNIFIDGTKIEAYANKYTFVWKKSVLRNKEKLTIKIDELLSIFNSIYNKNVSKIEDR